MGSVLMLLGVIAPEVYWRTNLRDFTILVIFRPIICVFLVDSLKIMELVIKVFFV